MLKKFLLLLSLTAFAAGCTDSNSIETPTNPDPAPTSEAGAETAPTIPTMPKTQQ